MRIATPSLIAAVLLSVPAAIAAQRGDTTVIQIGPPVHAGIAPLVEEFTLGRGSTAAEFTFTTVDLALGSDGALYVIDSPTLTASTVRKYGPDGRYIGTIGRNGDGPGEYRWIVGDVKELPDGRVLMSDTKGVLVYSRDGKPLGQWPAKSYIANVGSELLLDPAGFLQLWGAPPYAGSPPGSCPVTTPLFLQRFRLDGSVVDTIRPPFAGLPNPAQNCRVFVPFVPRYHYAWSPMGYFVTTYNTRYAVDLRVPPRSTSTGNAARSVWREGDPVISLRRASPPAVAVQKAESDDFRLVYTFNVRANTRDATWQWTGMDIPRTKPAIRELSVTDDGRIWVRLSQPAKLNASILGPAQAQTRQDSTSVGRVYRRWEEPFLYDVLEPSGRYLGQVRLPDSITQFVARGDTLWISSRDSNDVPVVKRYRIGWR